MPANQQARMQQRCWPLKRMHEGCMSFSMQALSVLNCSGKCARVDASCVVDNQRFAAGMNTPVQCTGRRNEDFGTQKLPAFRCRGCRCSRRTAWGLTPS